MKLAKTRVFSAYDGKLGVYMTPFFMTHMGQALRAWEDLCNNSESLMAKHPSDFVLYEIGEFDDDKGVLNPHVPARQVATALEVRRKSEAPSTLKALQ